MSSKFSVILRGRNSSVRVSSCRCTNCLCKHRRNVHKGVFSDELVALDISMFLFARGSSCA